MLSHSASQASSRAGSHSSAAVTKHQRAGLARCRAQQISSMPSPTRASPPINPMMLRVVEMLFNFPPFFALASKGARNMIIKRAESMGIDWHGAVKELKAQDWGKYLSKAENPAVRYPAYYTKPFHAYPKGNLCLDAALEVTMAAKSVHAFVMDPAGKAIDPEGDHMLRSSYSARMRECMTELGVSTSGIKDIVDIGCAAGLSSLELLDAFKPNSPSVMGIDLSPHFLAVGRYHQQKREAANGGAPEPLTFVHAAAECTGLPSSSQDLVSICLVFHELPQKATREVLKEAFRILRPGGCVSIMEMNPTTPAFQRVLSNPFAFTAFKSTEPWLEEYVTLDLHQAIREQGFQAPLQKESTPRHRTVVAVKPRQ